jgi:signal transduction histidine kinase
MKTQTKLALIIGVIFIAIIISFGFAIYYFQNNYAFGDFYKRLETRAKISAQYNLELGHLDGKTLKRLRHQHLETLDNEKEYIVELAEGYSYEQIAQKYDLPEYFVEIVIQEGKSNLKQGNEFFYGLVHKRDKASFLVVVSAENYYVTHHLIFLRNLLFASVILIILIIISLSFYFSRHIFDPIKDITDRVKQISTENIHLRLDKFENNKEMNELINTFNDLLNRIETAFETQKNFISNASHELGNPLTAIIGEADVALLKDRSTDEYKNSLNIISTQAERLQKITTSLLFLAQTAYKGKAIVFEMVRVDEVLWETKALIDKLNPANKIIIDISLLPDDPHKLKVNGNRQLLQLALANIMNNASKYSNNKEVFVHIASSNSFVIVVIDDQGIGIPEAELQYIYDPFFRASNTSLFEGYGIGLPLASNVVLWHKGTLQVKSVVNKGTTVEIRLPNFVF